MVIYMYPVVGWAMVIYSCRMGYGDIHVSSCRMGYGDIQL